MHHTTADAIPHNRLIARSHMLGTWGGYVCVPYVLSGMAGMSARVSLDRDNAWGACQILNISSYCGDDDVIWSQLATLKYGGAARLGAQLGGGRHLAASCAA